MDLECYLVGVNLRRLGTNFKGGASKGGLGWMSGHIVGKRRRRSIACIYIYHSTVPHQGAVFVLPNNRR